MSKSKKESKGKKRRIEEVEIKGHKFVKIFSGGKVKMLTSQEYELLKK